MRIRLRRKPKAEPRPPARGEVLQPDVLRMLEKLREEVERLEEVVRSGAG